MTRFKRFVVDFDDLPALEKSVDEQAGGVKPYSLETGLTVLRLYALQPAAARPDTVAKVLMKALMQLPAADYKTCIYLVPERMQAEEPLSTLVLLAAHLESGRLADFWALAQGSRDLLTLVPGFMDAARRFVAHTLTITFARLPKRQAAEALRLDGKELDAYLADKVQRDGWSLDGELVAMPRNEHNTPSQKRAVDMVSFGAVAPALLAA